MQTLEILENPDNGAWGFRVMIPKKDVWSAPPTEESKYCQRVRAYCSKLDPDEFYEMSTLAFDNTYSMYVDFWFTSRNTALIAKLSSQ